MRDWLFDVTIKYRANGKEKFVKCVIKEETQMELMKRFDAQCCRQVICMNLNRSNMSILKLFVKKLLILDSLPSFWSIRCVLFQECWKWGSKVFEYFRSISLFFQSSFRLHTHIFMRFFFFFLTRSKKIVSFWIYKKKQHMNRKTICNLQYV